VFHGVEMPPPSGAFGTNYTRFVEDESPNHTCLIQDFRFIHREGSRHKYAVSWTTSWSPELGRDGGGHFFMCSHGVKVEAAADTVIVWQPKTYHGTSLQCRDPNNSDIFQAGLAIVTPPSLDKLWAEVLEKKISVEEARRMILELESEEVEA
jgi:hypothetical protein